MIDIIYRPGNEVVELVIERLRVQIPFMFPKIIALPERMNRKRPMYCTLILSGGAGLDRHLRPEGEQYKDKFAKKNHVMLKIVQKAITRGTYSQFFKLPG